MSDPESATVSKSFSDRARRLVICAVIVAALVVGTLAAHVSSKNSASTVAFALPAAAGVSAVAPKDVSSTAWYCTSGLPATLVLSSSSAAAVSATVTRNSAGASETVSVPAGGQVQLPPPSRSAGPEGATVILNGGGVAVSESIRSAYGWSMTQCASSTSTTWYFPQGSTVAGDTVMLDLYDPSVTQAVVDIDLVTPSGQADPTDYQGVSVPAGGLVTEKLDEHATNDPEVATIVDAASGSVVAEELQRTTSGHAVGIAEELGAPRPQTLWGFPYCVEPRGGSLTFNMVNAGPQASQVVLEATYGRGVAVHPVMLSVQPDSTASIVLGHEPGFAASTPYAVLIKSSSGLVVGRSIERPKKSPRPNAGDSLGVPVGTEHWLLPAAPTTGRPASLTFEDLGSRPVRVTITKALGGSAPVLGVGNVVLVQPGEQVGIAGSVLAAFTEPFDVDADGPVAVELDASPAASPGVVVIPAFAVP
jgi:hypothetical protein